MKTSYVWGINFILAVGIFVITNALYNMAVHEEKHRQTISFLGKATVLSEILLCTTVIFYFLSVLVPFIRLLLEVHEHDGN